MLGSELHYAALPVLSQVQGGRMENNKMYLGTVLIKANTINYC